MVLGSCQENQGDANRSLAENNLQSSQFYTQRHQLLLEQALPTNTHLCGDKMIILPSTKTKETHLFPGLGAQRQAAI